MMPVHPEVIFAAIYAVFLGIIARVLQRGARRIASIRAPIRTEERGLEDEPSWAHGLAARFRIGLALAIQAVAFFTLLSAVWRFHHAGEAMVIAGAGASLLWAGRPLWKRPADRANFR